MSEKPIQDLIRNMDATSVLHVRWERYRVARNALIEAIVRDVWARAEREAINHHRDDQEAQVRAYLEEIGVGDE